MSREGEDVEVEGEESEEGLFGKITPVARDEDQGGDEMEMEYTGPSSSWCIDCPESISLEFAEDVISDAERRLRVLGWLRAAGISDSMVQEEGLLNQIRSWVPKRMREVLLDETRDEHVSVFGWAHVTESDIDFISEKIKVMRGQAGDGTFKIIEIGGGSGWLAWLLGRRGVAVESFDTGGESGVGGVTYVKEWRQWPWSRSVKLGDVDELEKMASVSSVLLLSWPDMSSGFATQCLDKFKGKFVIYLGEDKGGCCGETSFFERLAEWKLLWSKPLMHASGVKDYIGIFSRETTTT